MENKDKFLLNSTNNDIKLMAQTRVRNLQEEDIIKTGKKTKTLYITIFVFVLTFGAICTASTIYGIFVNHMSWVIFLIMTIACYTSAFFIMRPSMFKWDYKQWTLFQEEKNLKNIKQKLESAESTLQELSSIDGKKIKYTQIIDSYTEYTDKLHGSLNYQEIIQHRIYKFLVTFEDNSTKIYNAEEGTKNYNKLISFLKNNSVKEQTIETNTHKLSIADELEKYKKLLDNGTITTDEFTEIKNKLLNK